MPILGKVNATPYECRVENMEIGASGYIYIEEIIITKSSLFVYLSAEVTFPDDDDEMEYDSLIYLPIKRIGAGLTEDDFELDFSKSDEADIFIDPNSLNITLRREKGNYIVFTNFEIGPNNESDKGTPKTKLEILQSRLQDALDEDTKESYERATKIRGEIAEEQKKIQTKDK